MPDVTERACPVCGATFAPYRNRRRVQTFCSPLCGSRADVRRLPSRGCLECGVSFRPKDRRGRFCGDPCRWRYVDRSRPKRPPRGWKDKVCAWCGVNFRTVRKSECCSGRCGVLRHHFDGKATLIPWAECGWCGRSFIKHGVRKYCSQACLDANHPYRSRVTDIEYGDCRRCGRLFVRRKGRVGSWCSETCAKRGRKSYRKHLKRAGAGGEPFTLREVADRDGWRCHICGRKVPDREYRARDRDPTIDHLMPVSAGGTHTLDNVALAHNRCNWQRSTGGTVQLRLSG